MYLTAVVLKFPNLVYIFFNVIEVRAEEVLLMRAGSLPESMEE